MTKIKFKILFLLFSAFIFIFILLNSETNLFKKEISSKPNIQKIRILNIFNSGLFQNYANFLINNRIISNKEILNFTKINSVEPSQIKIDVEYFSEQDLENYIKKIKKEINFINLTLKRELDRYLNNKNEFLLLDENTKLYINYYKEEKIINLVTLIINEKIEVNNYASKNKFRYVFYIFFSLILAFLLSFFLKIFIKNKKNLTNFFYKL
jgi:hypothetical protein